MTTEYTSFEEATAALGVEVARGTQNVSIKAYQRPSDLVWVWAVTSVATPPV